MNTTLDETAPSTPEEVTGLYWSLNEAARQTGLNKGNISRNIAEGKLQWHDRPDGIRKLSASEVMHVYGDRIRQRRNRVVLDPSITSLQHPNTDRNALQHLVISSQLTSAEVEICHLKELLEIEKQRRVTEEQRRDKAEKEQDRWYQAYQELKALPAPETKQQKPAPKSGFFGRIFGKS
jgi:hypothetical protein